MRNSNFPLVVAIWMVTYNHEDYIEKAVESVMMQDTMFNFRLFIGEDNSTDKTAILCKKLQEKYPNKMSLVLNKNNLGATKNASNIYDLCFKSGAKYVAMLEGDDYWTDPLKLQKQVDFLEVNENVKICFHRSQILKNNSYTLHAIPVPFNKQSFKYIELIKHYNFIATASVLFRKPKDFKLPNWFYNLPFGDMGLYKMISQDKKIQCLDEVMCVYRVHDEGIYSGLSEFKMQQNYLNFYKIIFPVLNTEERAIATHKIKMNSYKMSKLKFPKNRLLQKIYNMYLRHK